ncbi:MAG: SRPBCC family protein [Parahaliea sp.]
MNFRLFSGLCITLVISLSVPVALAHGPTPKRSTQSINIDATPDKVWAVVSAYTDIYQWHPDISTSSSDKGDERGSERRITFTSGGHLTDNLDVHDSGRKVIAWRLLYEDVAVFPTSSYNMRITVFNSDNGNSRVEWNAVFFRGDTHNEPPEHLSDEAAIKAVTAFQNSGLQALKARLESP